jgi:hypothetical protein
MPQYNSKKRKIGKKFLKMCKTTRLIDPKMLKLAQPNSGHFLPPTAPQKVQW